MKDSMFKALCFILNVIEGDRIDQEDLYDVQYRLCGVLLHDSNQKQHKYLAKEFPHFFRLKKAGE